MDYPNIQSLATMEKLSQIESVPRHNIVLRATETKSPQSKMLLYAMTSPVFDFICALFMAA